MRIYIITYYANCIGIGTSIVNGKRSGARPIFCVSNETLTQSAFYPGVGSFIISISLGKSSVFREIQSTIFNSQAQTPG